MKKITSIILTALLAVGLVACDNTEQTAEVTTIEPVVTTTEPVVTTTEPVVTTTEPVVTTTEPVVTTTEPVVTTTAEPVVTTTEPVVTTTEPVVTTTAEPVVTTTEPVVTTAEPVVTTAEPVVTTTEPVVTTAEPVVTTTEPVVTTAEPVETTEPEEFNIETANLGDYVLLGKYIGIEVFVPAPEPISDTEVDEQINAIISSLPLKPEQAITNRACAEGDSVNINFVGTLDGVAFEGGSAEAQPLTLGEGRFIPGFEEGIIGKIPGDVFTITVTFPTDYHAADLAGKEAQFEITLNYIYPPLSDEIALEYFGNNSAEELRTAVRAELEKQAYAALADEREAAAWTKVLANSAVAVYPDDLVNEEFEIQKESYRQLAEGYGMTYEQLFEVGYGIAVGEAEEILFEAAKNATKQKLVLFAIAREKGMPLDDASYEADMLALAQSFGITSIDELLSATGYTKSQIKEMLIYSSVIAEIVENANFVETSK